MDCRLAHLEEADAPAADAPAEGDRAGRKRPHEEIEAEADATPDEEAAGESAVAMDGETLKQIRVDGLHKWATPKQVRQRLEVTLGLSGIRKLKKFNNQDFAFVYFETVEARAEGYEPAPEITPPPPG